MSRCLIEASFFDGWQARLSCMQGLTDQVARLVSSLKMAQASLLHCTLKWVSDMPKGHAHKLGGTTRLAVHMVDSEMHGVIFLNGCEIVATCKQGCQQLEGVKGIAFLSGSVATVQRTLLQNCGVFSKEGSCLQAHHMIVRADPVVMGLLSAAPGAAAGPPGMLSTSAAGEGAIGSSASSGVSGAGGSSAGGRSSGAAAASSAKADIAAPRAGTRSETEEAKAEWYSLRHYSDRPALELRDCGWADLISCKLLGFSGAVQVSVLGLMAYSGVQAMTATTSPLHDGLFQPCLAWGAPAPGH